MSASSPPTEQPPPLSARRIARDAASTLVARPGRILVVAATVALVGALFDLGLDRVAERLADDFSGVFVTLLVALAVIVTGANSFGSTFLAGVLDKTVGEARWGHAHLSLWQVLLVLPLGALVVADILVAIIRIVGWVLLFVPGIIAITLTAITGPVLILESRGPLSAIRRSAQLIRPVFWLALRAVTIPMMLEAFVGDWLESLPFAHGFLAHAAILLVAEVPLMTFVALLEVTLAYHLVEGAPREEGVRAGGLEPPRH